VGINGGEIKVKKSTVIEVTILIMGILLACTLITLFYMWDAYSKTEEQLSILQTTLEQLQQQVQTTAQYVAVGNISIAFTPFEREKVVPGTAITYLMGFVRVYDLKNIVVRPVTLIVTFTPEIITPYNTTGEITYSHTDVQVLEIPPELDSVELPWGAFPVTLKGFVKGEEIYWKMNVTATAQWMGNDVTSISVTATYKFIIT